ncbi:MAG: hypothetical protein KAJ63_02515 [Methyloprofundus sp.]|nr:hypothetical protein [Methyloprofundus sp.]
MQVNIRIQVAQLSYDHTNDSYLFEPFVNVGVFQDTLLNRVVYFAHLQSSTDYYAIEVPFMQ